MHICAPWRVIGTRTLNRGSGGGGGGGGEKCRLCLDRVAEWEWLCTVQRARIKSTPGVRRSCRRCKRHPVPC